jgi:hypothetical protein
MDRDDDGVPDYLEDANYADEAPVRGPYRTRARRYRGGGPGPVGCAFPLAVVLAAAGALARRSAGRRRR